MHAFFSKQTSIFSGILLLEIYLLDWFTKKKWLPIITITSGSPLKSTFFFQNCYTWKIIQIDRNLKRYWKASYKQTLALKHNFSWSLQFSPTSFHRTELVAVSALCCSLVFFAFGSKTTETWKINLTIGQNRKLFKFFRWSRDALRHPGMLFCIILRSLERVLQILENFEKKTVGSGWTYGLTGGGG